MTHHLFGPYSMSPWTPIDADAFVEYGATQEVASFMRDGFPYPCSKDEAVKFINQFLGAQVAGADIFAIRCDGTAIGSIGLFEDTGVHPHCAELAYWLGSPFWGKGVMKAAIRAMVSYGLKILGYKRIFALPFATNVRSCSLLERCDFQNEGTIHKSERKGNAYVEQKIYAITQGAAGDAITSFP